MENNVLPSRCCLVRSPRPPPLAAAVVAVETLCGDVQRGSESLPLRDRLRRRTIPN